jgi:ribulose-phosphate 3-epimerase
MVRIAPSVLSADFSRLGDEVKKCEEGGAELIHVDVMDGHFVPNITIGPLVVKALKKRTVLPLDVHLMITDPDKYIEAFAEAGAAIITVHAEACPHLHRTLQLIKSKGAKAGVALNPSTDLTAVRQVLNDVDLLVIMTVNPGFGGQSFIHSVVPKIKEARELISKNGAKTEIEVDGGINVDTASIVAKAGAEILVAGNAVFGSADVPKAIAAIRSAAKV